MANRFSGKIIGYALLGLGYYEAAIGILQWLGILHSHHYGYSFTGTFYNPGPYACFLSIMVPIAVSMMAEHNHRTERWIGTGMVLICAILIPATLSRTAMIACATGTAIALWNSIYSYLRKVGKVYVILGSVVFMIATVCLYSVKKDSADGRILMWKVAAEAVIDTPLTGIGWDNVAGEYGEAQERYFESGKASEQEFLVADAPEYVFNEYLQVAIAFGPLAAVLMFAILFGGIVSAFKNHNHGMAGSTVAASIVMFSSYPLQFPLFVITIGIVLTGCYLSSNSVWTKVSGAGITVCCIALFLANSHRTDVNSEFHIAHTLHRQGKYGKSNEILIELKRHSADPMILNIIGKNFQSLGMPDSAIYYLMKSTFRCPNRMYPHYLLMKLYNDSISYNKKASLREAQIIVSMKPKVESEATRDMKREAGVKLKNEI
ncbi:MAG: O-antigen ligase family protein [Muribaculum sp.]|nr:O-antigen ligase family protein [Muribaculum sp.]